VNDDTEEPQPASGRQPVDITVPVLVAAGAVVLAVGLAYWRGAIPRPLAAVTTAGLGVMVVLLAVLDFVCELTRRRSVGQRFQTWSRRYPMYAFVMILVVGGLFGHFFWQEATSPPVHP
jgi:hypothetical protein